MSLKKAISLPLGRAAQLSAIEQVLTRIFAACPNCLEVYIFGSASKLQMTETSDVDVLLVFSEEKELKSAKQNYYRNTAKLSFPVDILFFSRALFEKMKRIGGLAQECLNGIRICRNEFLERKSIESFFQETSLKADIS